MKRSSSDDSTAATKRQKTVYQVQNKTPAVGTATDPVPSSVTGKSYRKLKQAVRPIAKNAGQTAKPAGDNQSCAKSKVMSQQVSSSTGQQSESCSKAKKSSSLDATSCVRSAPRSLPSQTLKSQKLTEAQSASSSKTETQTGPSDASHLRANTASGRNVKENSAVISSPAVLYSVREKRPDVVPVGKESPTSTESGNKKAATSAAVTKVISLQPDSGVAKKKKKTKKNSAGVATPTLLQVRAMPLELCTVKKKPRDSVEAVKPGGLNFVNTFTPCTATTSAHDCHPAATTEEEDMEIGDSVTEVLLTSFISLYFHFIY